MRMVREGFALPVCAEELGGLSTPRKPCEIIGGDGSDVLDGKAYVQTEDGADKTAEFIAGANAVLALAKECGVKEIIIHAPYIINLANTVKPDTYTFGVSFLAQELKRVAAFQSKILVLHPGSHLGAGAEAGIAQLVEGLNTVLAEDDSDVLIALETMA